MQNLNEQALRAAADREYMEKFIAENESFILQQAFYSSGHPVSKDSDEWSVSLIAFAKAVETYEADKGSFATYARVLIQNRLIDYFRSQNRYNPEIQTDPSDFFQVRAKEEERSLRDEILELNENLEKYGFTFSELEKCSPKRRATRRICGKILNHIAENPELIRDMQRKKMFPVKEIEKNLKVHRKIVERHRKYLIAASEILSGDYPGLAEYLESIRKEGV